jgi:hypothetical protein
MKVFETGRRLYQLTHNAGWQDVLDILEAEAVKYEYRLLNLAPDASETLLRGVQAHAQVARSIMEQLQLRIASLVEIGLQAATLPASEAQEAEYNSL